MQLQRFSRTLLYRTVLSQTIYQKILAFVLLCLTLVVAALPATTNAQGNPTTVPLNTLVPPTLLPLPPTPTATPLPVQSAVARIKARISATTSKPILVVGIPYNIPPFARITETGSIEGFEADIARAIAMIRYDDSLRTLIERTLQRLVSRGTLGSIYDRWFPGSDLLPEDKLFPRVWRDLDSDPRTFNDFGNDLVRPTQPVLARLRSGGTLRVAGLGEPAGITGQPSPLEGFNQAIVEEMARRWGVPVEYVPNSYGQGENILVANNADLAVGMEAKWGGAFDRIDFAGFYAQRGYRLMVRVGSGIESFAGFATGRRGVAVYADDATGFDMAKKLMEQAGILSESAQKVTYSNGDEIVDAVFNNNVRAGFADAFRFLPLANANTAKVVLTPRLYDPKPIAFGLQRNDPDFRLLIEVTLQEMAKDGTYQRLWAERFNIGDPLSVTQYPGPNTVFGYKVGN